MISFLRAVSGFSTDAFPIGSDRRLIAPFWADANTRIGGVIYYRETQDLATRTRASEEIRTYFVRQRRFLAQWVMIVTWLDVARYGGNSSPSVRSSRLFLSPIYIRFSFQGISSSCVSPSALWGRFYHGLSLTKLKR